MKFFPSVETTLAVAGAGLLSYGAWTIYEPAGFMTAGAMVLLAGLARARAVARRAKP